MLEIRRGLPSDYDQLIEQLVESFREHNPAHQRFEFLFPNVINPTEETMANWRLAFVDGKLAAGIELIPRHMQFGETVFTSGGIGNVHCWPKFRETGCFSALIKRIIEDMNKEGWGLGFLGGERTRYGNYGWEDAGNCLTMKLSSFVRRFDREAPRLHTCDFREYLGDEKDSLKMMEALKGSPAHPIRKTPEEFRLTMRHPSKVTYLNETEAEGFAYITISGNCICEYAGTVAGVERILTNLLRVGSWAITLPPVSCFGELEQMFMKYATGYNVAATGMVRVNSMSRVLNDYAPLLRKRLSCWNGERVIELEDGEKVSVAVHDGSLTIGETDRPATYKITRRECAQLFFGPFMPYLGSQQEDEFLRMAFPLPLVWFPMEHV